MTSDVVELVLGTLFFYCPGCKLTHLVRVDRQGKPNWVWNNEPKKPTLSPSVVVRFTKPARELGLGKNSGTQEKCHSYIQDGRILYLADCTHELAGKRMDMIPVDLWPA